MILNNVAKFEKILIKVRKMAKIRNRYDQVLHPTQDTNGKVTNSQLDITNESKDVSPFPPGFCLFVCLVLNDASTLVGH